MFTSAKDSDGNLPLPPDKMPKCWNEDKRMNSLFAPFRSKSANPQDWISKYKFWQNLIYEWLKHTARCTFTIADLNAAFKRKGCTPHCLQTVLEELLRNNEIISESEFLKEPCESWTAWSIDIFVKKPLSWSFSVVKSYVASNEINKETIYIHLQVVKEHSAVIYSVLEEQKENVLIPFSELTRNCKSKLDKNISDNTIMLALMWLRREKKVVFRNSHAESELLIKIATHSLDNITEIEEGLFKLRKQEDKLTKEIELMEEEKINIINETKSCLAKGLRQVAKTHLRKKKKLENTIEKHAHNLENIQSLISSIQNTHANTAVLSAFKTGSDVLRRLNESGLSENNVKDIMDDLSEALEEQKEVQSLLSESLKIDDSNTDFEEELAELMKIDENLPPVPNTELDSAIDDLDRVLKNLDVKGTTTANKSSESPINQVRKKKMLAQPGV